MRSTTPSQVARLLAVAAGALLAQCQTAPSPTPSPTATPTPQPEYPKERWGMIVLHQQGQTCTHLAGPPRIGAYAGETIIWRIFNNCTEDAMVAITDLRLSPPGFPGFTGAKSLDQINEVKRRRQEKTHEVLDPFDTVDKSWKVTRGAIDDLHLKVKDSPRSGLYTYVVTVNGRPDEGDIEIWPPPRKN